MSFIKMLKSNELIIEAAADVKEPIQKPQKKKEEKPEDVLRAAGFKIKLVTPTSFGTQVEFAKLYDDAAVEKALSDFNIKIKNKSVFIVS